MKQTMTIEEAFKALNSREVVDEAVENDAKIPSPYNKYYEVIDYEPENEGEYAVGDEIENYAGTHVLAYVALRPEYEDIEGLAYEAFLVDNPDFPICEVVGGRLCPVELPEIE